MTEFKILDYTEVVVEWEDSKGANVVSGRPGSVAAVLAAVGQIETRGWGVLRLRNPSEEVVWCDGTDSARRHFAARNPDA